MSKGNSDKKSIGDSVWAEMKKINSELFTMTYGGIVLQLLKENEYDGDKVNKELEEIGYNIGTRMVEEYLAKVESKKPKSANTFKEHVESLTYIGFKMFMGISCECVEINDKQWKISIPSNPLSEFVELPDKLKNKLWYSNVYCGVIKGCLEMLKYKVECKFISDILRGNQTTEIEVTLIDMLDQAKYVNYNE